MLEFTKDAGLTPAQLRGDDDIPIHKGANRLPYVHGKPLVWEQLLVHLPTRMYELHKWYMIASARGLVALEVRIEDYHYFRGRSSFNVPLEEFWFLFNQDALDVALVSC